MAFVVFAGAWHGMLFTMPRVLWHGTLRFDVDSKLILNEWCARCSVCWLEKRSSRPSFLAMAEMRAEGPPAARHLHLEIGEAAPCPSGRTMPALSGRSGNSGMGGLLPQPCSPRDARHGWQCFGHLERPSPDACRQGSCVALG